MTRRSATLAGFAMATALVSPAYANYPRLNAAEHSVANAIHALRGAPDIYAGRKARAVQLLERALAEIRAAKRYRR